MACIFNNGNLLIWVEKKLYFVQLVYILIDANSFGLIFYSWIQMHKKKSVHVAQATFFSVLKWYNVV